MSSQVQTVTVDLKDRSYDIAIGEGLIDAIADYLAPHLSQNRVFIVTEETVYHHQGARLEAALKAAHISAKWFILPAGESTKSFSHYEKLTSDLLAAGLERKDCLVAFGGGVIGDLTGFAAATVLRGVPFIQVPTTLLSQVDSSVGGKTAINSPVGKNLVGAFYQPKAVVIDIETLNTLPRRELLAGYAEVVKYGLIDDPDFFNWLESNGAAIVATQENAKTIEARIHAVHHSCTAKARIVAEDELETGKRALLNLGHTFGHALEAECAYDGSLLHGEAVAIGMVMALDASVELGIASPENRDRVVAHLNAIGMRTAASDLARKLDAETLLHHMFKDKKVEAGTIGFILGDIGTARMIRGVNLDIIRTVLMRSCAPDVARSDNTTETKPQGSDAQVRAILDEFEQSLAGQDQ